MTDLKKTILSFPKQFRVGVETAKDAKLKAGFRNVIFCGMGGSVMPSEILFALLPDLPNSFHIHRDYDLPAWANKDDLVVCISWSGGTAEIISSYEKAKKLGAKILVITKGGKLAELAGKNNDLSITLPQENIPPRSGVGYMSASLLTVLINSDMIDFKLEELTNLEDKLRPERFEEKGKELAERIGNWTPLIYSSFQNRFLASFWKVKFNENSKIHAFWNYFPNAAHNEIAGFGWDNFFAIFLSDEKDSPKQQKKLSVAKNLLEENAIPYEWLEFEGKTRIERIWSLACCFKKNSGDNGTVC